MSYAYTVQPIHIYAVQPQVYLQAVSVAFWAFSTLRYDTPACFDALAARAMQLLATEEDFNRANEQASKPSTTGNFWA